MAAITVEIVNRRGLHARASAKFVKLAETFDAQITIEKDGSSVSGSSIMGLMMLAAAKGDSIKLDATGPERGAALDSLKALVEAGFHEED